MDGWDSAWVRSGSDNAYGVSLSHMLFIITLTWAGWGRLSSVIPWPVLCLASVAIVFPFPPCSVTGTAAIRLTMGARHHNHALKITARSGRLSSTGAGSARLNSNRGSWRRTSHPLGPDILQPGRLT
jgi:hypothetical protein